jgi:hypothetical protein
MKNDKPILTLDDVKTFDAASVALRGEGCRISRDRVAELAFKHRIAIPWNLERRRRPADGKKPRQSFRVRLSDLRAAILAERTGERATSRPAPVRTGPRARTPLSAAQPLNPRVRC